MIELTALSGGLGIELNVPTLWSHGWTFGTPAPILKPSRSPSAKSHLINLPKALITREIPRILGTLGQDSGTKMRLYNKRYSSNLCYSRNTKGFRIFCARNWGQRLNIYFYRITISHRHTYFLGAANRWVSSCKMSENERSFFMILCLIAMFIFSKHIFVCFIPRSSTEQFKLHYLLGEISTVYSYYPCSYSL